MRKDGIFQRNDGKFEVWVKIPGGLDCKGVFDHHDKACISWVRGQPNDGVRRAIPFDSIPTYTEADLEVSTPESLLRRKVHRLINVYGIQRILEELAYDVTLRDDLREDCYRELVSNLRAALRDYKERYD
jgi:hypothetical protein